MMRREICCSPSANARPQKIQYASSTAASALESHSAYLGQQLVLGVCGKCQAFQDSQAAQDEGIVCRYSEGVAEQHIPQAVHQTLHTSAEVSGLVKACQVVDVEDAR